MRDFGLPPACSRRAWGYTSEPVSSNTLSHLCQKNATAVRRAVSGRLAARLLRVIGSEAGREDVLQNMVDIARTSRIEVDPVVVVADDIPSAIQNTSRRAALVILGFEPPVPEKEWVFHEVMERFAGDLPRVLMVHNAGGMQLES